MNKKNTHESYKNSYCFLFNKHAIIFKEHETNTELLLIEEVEKLGINTSEMIYIGTEDDNDYYAANASDKDRLQGYLSEDLREMYGKFPENIFLLALRALHFVNWLKKSKYCSCCGKKVQIEPKKTYIECQNCGHSMHPFVNPCIIVAILKDDKILLARSPHFPPDLYSLISGFVEAGEFIEDCVKREVKEEVGVEIKNIRFIGSHPWPFSNSLMFGFIAEHASGEITIDNNEIEAADWFPLDDLPKIPDSKLSYARRIIESLIKQRNELKIGL